LVFKVLTLTEEKKTGLEQHGK